MFPIYNQTFIVTGTFFNPAPFAGFMMICLPWGIFLSTSKWGNNRVNYTLSVIGYTSVILTLLIIPLTKSRTAMMGMIAILILWILRRYNGPKILREYLYTKSRKFLLIAASSVVFSLIGLGFFHLNPDSAKGRLLIWKVTATLIKDKPIIGQGFNTFQADYADGQAKYFEDQNRSATEQLIAGDVFWAFNEPLHILYENGLIGLLLFLSILFLSLFPLKGFMAKDRSSLAFFASLSILGFLFFSFFSYPFFSLPITLVFFTSVAIIAIKCNSKISKSLSMIVNLMQILAIMFTVGLYFTQSQKAENSYWLWDEACIFQKQGDYESALESFCKAYNHLKYNGAFLEQYAECLAKNKDYEIAINTLKQGKKYFCSSDWYMSMGNYQMLLGRFSVAETNFQKAANIVPCKFYPLYSLVKVYLETGQKDKAKQMAIKILEKDIKVPSETVKRIREEMKAHLDNL